MITCSIEILALEKKKKKKKLNSRTKNSQISNTSSTQPAQSDPIPGRIEKKHLLARFLSKSDHSDLSPFFVANSIHTGGATWPIVYYWPPSTGGEKKADTGILLEFLEADPAPARGNIFSLPLNVDVVCRWTSGSPNTEGQGRATPGGGRQQVTTGHAHTRPCSLVSSRSVPAERIDISTMCTE